MLWHKIQGAGGVGLPPIVVEQIVAPGSFVNALSVTKSFTSASAGQMLIVAVGMFGNASSVSAVDNLSASWTFLTESASVSTSTYRDIAIFYKIAAGGETSVTCTITGNNGCNASVMRLSGATQIAGSSTYGLNVAVDPASYTAGFTGRLWLAPAICRLNLTSLPSGYSNSTFVTTDSLSPAFAYKEVSATTENPPAWGATVSGGWATATIAVG